MTETEVPALASDKIERLRSLLKVTDKDKPKKEDVEALDTLLRLNPELWVHAGDLAEQAILRFIHEVEAKLPVKKSLEAGYRQLGRELTRPTDTVLERLLIQQVVLCWLHLTYVEYQYNGILLDHRTRLPVGDFWERRLNAAQRRYVRATETLARVRRMQLPAMQINIAAQQVNQLNEKS